MLRTVGDIVLAANMGSDLTFVVRRYLRAYRKYINGHNGITIKNDLFGIMLQGLTKDERVSVAVMDWYTTSYQVEEPIDWDADDAPNPSYGAQHSGSYRTEWQDNKECFLVHIPFSHLFIKDLDAYFKRKKAEIAEVERLRKLQAEEQALIQRLDKVRKEQQK